MRSMYVWVAFIASNLILLDSMMDDRVSSVRRGLVLLYYY